LGVALIQCRSKGVASGAVELGSETFYVLYVSETCKVWSLAAVE